MTLYYAAPRGAGPVVGGVEQEQLVEDVGHSGDLLPLGPRSPRHLLGAGLVQHVLQGGGTIFELAFDCLR